jgi:hypothetical protein
MKKTTATTKMRQRSAAAARAARRQKRADGELSVLLGRPLYPHDRLRWDLLSRLPQRERLFLARNEACLAACRWISDQDIRSLAKAWECCPHGAWLAWYVDQHPGRGAALLAAVRRAAMAALAAGGRLDDDRKARVLYRETLQCIAGGQPWGSTADRIRSWLDFPALPKG